MPIASGEIGLAHFNPDSLKRQSLVALHPMALALDKHAVPGQAAGHSYQFDLALKQLAEGSTGGRVGIETLDDVAKQDNDGTTVLQQGKSSVDSHALPFADGSFGLWNALHTWADAIVARNVDPRSTWFDLVSNTAIPSCLARELSDAQEDSEISACIAKLRAVPAQPSQKTLPHVIAVRSMSDEVLRSLIRQVRCFGKCEGMTVAAIHRDVAGKLKLPAGVASGPVIEELLGWLKVQVHRKWEARAPAWIQQDHFNNRLHAAIEKNRRRRVRELPARQIVCTEEEVERHKTSCFVRQLELVDCTSQDVEDGILDLLRHDQERLRLTAEGDVTDDDWLEFDDRLVEHWKPIFRKNTSGVPKTHKVKQRAAGRAVYDEVQSHRESLSDHPTVEYYLTRGAFHRLADLIRLGWHPNYDALCKRFKVGA
jgi:hypothetical protein